ncbi:hypothetical protein [Novosphingobium sp. fls2-241-R2A-195]|jgi:hypothetical protein|uniref:hypothetical protein n=1 Tax=Novosphingobium sp. fls2-241-R2A-195 TaxID=3040296 RepID=UPI00254E91C5|nr:hypothetical protein [Novosphingobium sp. fls2-241-R2A-195]
MAASNFRLRTGRKRVALHIGGPIIEVEPLKPKSRLQEETDGHNTAVEQAVRVAGRDQNGSFVRVLISDLPWSDKSDMATILCDYA